MFLNTLHVHIADSVEGWLFLSLFIVCIYQVYIVLYGEDGVSQTKELHVPGCTLFRRNSQDTFILR